MTAWQIPVFDRTAADLYTNAEKCCFSPQMLNRIEGNTHALGQLVKYTTSPRAWTAADFLTAEEMQRILRDLDAVRRIIAPEMEPLPTLADAKTWWGVNAIERTQWRLMQHWQAEQDNKNYAGELFAGDRIGVI